MLDSFYRPSEIKQRWNLSIRNVGIAVLAATGWILGLMIWSHHTLVEQHHHHTVHAANVVSPHIVANKDEIMDEAEAEGDSSSSLIEDLWPDDYEDAALGASMESCVKDCVVAAVGQKETKIGLLFPPGSIGLKFEMFVRLTAQAHAKFTNNNMLWIPTFHLPPSKDYYSHIIRFSNLPLLLAVGDALLFVASPSELTNWQEVPEAAKLILTWHCQLSIWAQHKAVPLLTMTMEDIEEDPAEQERSMLQLLPQLHPHLTEGYEEAAVDEDQLTNSLQQSIHRIKKTLKKLDEQCQKDANARLEAVVKQVIQDYHLKDDNQCDPTLTGKEIYVPSTPIAKRLYQFMQPAAAAEHDFDRLKNCQTEFKDTLVCQTLLSNFDAHQLLESYEKQQKEEEEGNVNMND